MAALGSSFLFFSAPAPYFNGFVMHLKQIQVGLCIGDRNWPILVCMTFVNASKNMERFYNFP